jgi:hypothetical protein
VTVAIVAAGLLSVGLAMAAMALPWARRCGSVPGLRVLAAAIAGGGSAVMVWLASRDVAASELTMGPAARLSDHLGGLGIAALSVAGAMALAILASAAGDRLAMPSFAIGLALSFSFGMSATAIAVAGSLPAKGDGSLVFALATLTAAAATVGGIVGSARLRAGAGEKLLLVVLGVTAGALLVAGAVVCFTEFVAAGPAWRWMALSAAELGAATGIVAVVWRWEGRTIDAELRDEAALGVIPAELAAAPSPATGSAAARWWPRVDERRMALGLLAQLALRKHVLRQLAGDRARIYSLEVGRLRERVRRALRPPDPSLPGEDGGG